jgi:predicted RNase H-like HicB family nuclease
MASARKVQPMNLTIIVHKAEEGGYWAKVPGLPGCYTQAETREELQANVLDAIEGWLSVTTEQAAEKEEGEAFDIEFAIRKVSRKGSALSEGTAAEAQKAHP